MPSVSSEKAENTATAVLADSFAVLVPVHKADNSTADAPVAVAIPVEMVEPRGKRARPSPGALNDKTEDSGDSSASESDDSYHPNAPAPTSAPRTSDESDKQSDEELEKQEKDEEDEEDEEEEDDDEEGSESDSKILNQLTLAEKVAAVADLVRQQNLSQQPPDKLPEGIEALETLHAELIGVNDLTTDQVNGAYRKAFLSKRRKLPSNAAKPRKPPSDKQRGWTPEEEQALVTIKNAPPGSVMAEKTQGHGGQPKWKEIAKQIAKLLPGQPERDGASVRNKWLRCRYTIDKDYATKKRKQEQVGSDANQTDEAPAKKMTKTSGPNKCRVCGQMRRGHICTGRPAKVTCAVVNEKNRLADLSMPIGIAEPVVAPAKANAETQTGESFSED